MCVGHRAATLTSQSLDVFLGVEHASESSDFESSFMSRMALYMVRSAFAGLADSSSLRCIAAS